MTAGRDDYRTVQETAFSGLVEDGTYDLAFEHSDYLKAFFGDVLQSVLSTLPQRPLRVLEAGCGSGAWLYHLITKLLPSPPEPAVFDLYGFDLTPAMAELAARHLASWLPDTRLQAGDVLDPAAYRFDGGPQRFDLIYAFDVVQQLPPARQFDACRSLIEHTAPEGACVIFDHDSRSPYGYRMGMKKFITAWLGIPLLPRYYCNAKYPPLASFRDRIQAEGLGRAEIRQAPDGKKRALIVYPEQERKHP